LLPCMIRWIRIESNQSNCSAAECSSRFSSLQIFEVDDIRAAGRCHACPLLVAKAIHISRPGAESIIKSDKFESGLGVDVRIRKNIRRNSHPFPMLLSGFARMVWKSRAREPTI
jgi:hypothetical protein